MEEKVREFRTRIPVFLWQYRRPVCIPTVRQQSIDIWPIVEPSVRIWIRGKWHVASFPMRMKNNVANPFCAAKSDTFRLALPDRGPLFDQSGPRISLLFSFFFFSSFFFVRFWFCHFIIAIKGGVIAFAVNAVPYVRATNVPAWPNVI